MLISKCRLAKIQGTTSASMLALAAAVAFCAAPASAAWAADDAGASASAAGDATHDKDNTIVVTAEKRTENIQDVPIAISAYSRETLAQRGIRDVEDLQQIAPSFQAGFKLGGTQIPSIRGIGSQLYNLAGEPAVAVAIDGVVYTSQNSLGLNFFDVDRIEVLRGPQGTISGRNATAGAVNIISARPTEELTGSIKATYGSFNRQAVEGVVSGPIIGDRLLGRLAVRNDRDDGWIHNTLLDQELGKTDLTQIRASLLGKLTDRFEATLIFDHTSDKSDPVIVGGGSAQPGVPSLEQYYGVPAFNWDDRTIQQDVPTRADIERYQGTVKLDWAISPSMHLSAISGIVDVDYDVYTDQLDGTGVAAGVEDPKMRLRFGVRQYSQEVTLTGNLSSRLDFIAGAIYIANDLTQSTPGTVFPIIHAGPNIASAEQKLSSIGGYAQVRWHLTDTLTAIAGARYTRDTKRYSDATLRAGAYILQAAKASWDAWTPKFTLSYEPSRNLTIYATASKGFKSGGFQTLSIPLQQFNPEYVWNYEVGVKGSALNGRLSGSLTGFYMDYTDLQQGVYTFSAYGLGVGTIVSANSARVKGIEAELSAQITDRLHIDWNGTLLDAKYNKLTATDPLYPANGPVSAAGKYLVRAPRFQFNVAATYRIPIGAKYNLDLNGNYAWQDRVYFDIFNNPLVSQAPYGLLNASISLKPADERWELRAFVTNATNKFYKTHEIPSFIAPVPAVPATIGRPRTFGVSAGYKF